MQSMPASTRPSILRKVLEEQLSVLAGELASLHEQELASREAEQRESLICELAEGLNQAVRLLRQAENFAQMAAVITDASISFCKLLAVFSVDGDRVRAERARGLTAEGAEQFAAAVAHATGEMVAVNQDTGKIEWDDKLPSSPYGAAAVTNGVVFTTTYNGYLYASDAATGAILLKTPLSAGPNAPVTVDGAT